METMIYAVLGQIGAGKTTYATALAKEKGAVFFSMDQTFAKLGVPIQSYADYEKFYPGTNSVIKNLAKQVIQLGIPVVFDYGVNRQKGRTALKQFAETEGVDLELHHIIVPADERLRRVRERNRMKLPDIFSFEISDEEFEFISTVYMPPIPEEGLRVVEIRIGV